MLIEYLRKMAIPYSIALIGLLIAICIYPSLPAHVPIQWNRLIVEEIAPKFSIIGIPLLSILLTALAHPAFEFFTERFIATCTALPTILSAGIACFMLTFELYSAAFCYGLFIPIFYIILAEFFVLLAVCIAYVATIVHRFGRF